MIGIQDIAELSSLPPWHLHRLGVKIGVKRISVAAAAGFVSKAALAISQSDLVVVVTGIINSMGGGNTLSIGLTAAAAVGTDQGILNLDWQTLDDPTVGARNLPGVAMRTDNTTAAFSENAGTLGLLNPGIQMPDGMLPMILIAKTVGTPIFLGFQPQVVNVALEMSIRVLTFRKLRDTDVRESLESYVEPFIGPPVPVMSRAIRDRIVR